MRIFSDEFDACERAELRAQNRFDSRRAAQLWAHPDPRDPDHPDDEEESESDE